MSDMHDEQVGLWQRLYDKVCDVLETFGVEDSHQPGDYWVHDSYWGHLQIKIYVHNLALVKPPVVNALRKTLASFRGWEIVVAINMRGQAPPWPDMGLIIRANEIIDRLQRQYLPKEFQDIRYEGSRPGTDRD